MEIRKILLAVFIVFALSMSYQPANSLVIIKECTVLCADARKDGHVRDFIEKNKIKSFAIMISLTAALYYIDYSFCCCFNTS